VTVLVDTSVWIDYFRGTEPVATELSRVLADEPPVICGPILAELVAGTPSAQREDVWLALAGLPFVELGRDDWTRCGEVANELRRSGARVPLLDILIAAAAVGAGAALWTRDSDFERIREVLGGLRLYG
jgi:predicted nucleic acid-binding protein